MAGYRDTLFGGQSLFGRTTSNTAGGTSGSGQSAAMAERQNQPAQTFSQLQQQGVARPAPPAPQLQQNAQYGGSQQANQVRGGLQQQVMNSMQNPGRYNSQAYQQIEGAARANLDADYQAQLQAMNTDMARRGLYDSTYAAQGWQSLAGQRARAMADLNASLLQDAASTNAQDQLAANQMGLSLADLAGSQDLAQFEANRVATALDNENAFRTAEFQQGQYENDRQTALEAAQAQSQQGTQQQQLMLDELLGLGALDVKQGDLDLQDFLGRQSLGIQRDQLGLERDKYMSGVDQANADRALQQMLGMGDLGVRNRGLDQSQNQFEQNLQFQGNQSAADRAQQLALQGNELGFNREQLAEQGRQFNQGLDLDQQRLAEQMRQFNVGAEDTDLARALQERLGVGELSGRIDGQNTVARDQATADQDLARQNMLLNLLNSLGFSIGDLGLNNGTGSNTGTNTGGTNTGGTNTGGTNTGGTNTGGTVPGGGANTGGTYADNDPGDTQQVPGGGTNAQVQLINQILPILLAQYGGGNY